MANTKFTKFKIMMLDLENDFDSFCKSQENCKECVLSLYEFINDDYDQPCEQVYSLLRLVQNK